MSWIEWYCMLEDHQFVTRIDKSFIADPANYEDLLKNAAHLNFGPLPKHRLEDCIKLILA